MSNAIWSILLAVVMTACHRDQSHLPPAHVDTVLINTMKDDLRCFLKSETIRINPNLHLQDIRTDSIKIFSDLLQKNALFFYFSRYQCGECIDRELEYINALYPNDRVIIIGKEASKRHLTILQKTKQIQQPIYWMKPEYSFKMPWESLQRPIFFKVNSLGYPYNMYSPKFSYPQFSLEYHATMSGKRLANQ